MERAERPPRPPPGRPARPGGPRPARGGGTKRRLRDPAGAAARGLRARRPATCGGAAAPRRASARPAHGLARLRDRPPPARLTGDAARRRVVVQRRQWTLAVLEALAADLAREPE